MPRRDKASYQEYMREYMRSKRRGLTGINKDLNVGVRGLEPPTSASRTLRATNLRYTPQPSIIGGFNLFSNNDKLKNCPPFEGEIWGRKY